jgi:membrane protease YdiL (CAAX protease family)
MNEEIGKTVKLIVFWLFLYLATTVIATVLGRVFNNYEILKWTIVLGYMLIAILFFGKRYVELSFGQIERRMVWPVIGMSVLVAASYLFFEASFYILIDIVHLFPKESKELHEAGQHISGIAGILSFCIFGPIAEEICFRGILLGGLLKMRCRPWIAILITALAFSLVHGYAVKLVGTLLIGIIVGWLYWRTGSIIPCLIIHIVNNSIAGIIYLIGQPTNTVLIVILIVCLLSLSYGLWWFWKKFNFVGEVNQDMPKV